MAAHFSDPLSDPLTEPSQPFFAPVSTFQNSQQTAQDASSSLGQPALSHPENAIENQPIQPVPEQSSGNLLPNVSPIPPRDPLPGQSTTHYRPISQPSPATLQPRDSQYSPPRPRADSDSPQPQHPPMNQPEPFLRFKVHSIEKNKREVYIKFNVETNLASYRFSNYRSLSRSYSELVKLTEVLAVTCPQSILPSIPFVQTSAATDAEDDRIIRHNFQVWFNRIIADNAVIRQEELRHFIENDFGYNPISKQKRKMPSSFSFSKSKLPDEQDDDLTIAKNSMSKLELQFNETAKLVDRVAKTRKSLATVNLDLAEQLNTFSTTESYKPLADGLQRLSKSLKVSTDYGYNQATHEMVTLADPLNYQSLNARVAKECLLGRDVLLDEYRSAAKLSISKQYAIEKLRRSSSIKADRVDEALEEHDEALANENLLAKRLQDVNQHLQPSLRTHSINAHQDIINAFIEYSRSQLQHEKVWLKELESLRNEIRTIKNPQIGVVYHSNTTVAPTRPAAEKQKSVERVVVAPTSSYITSAVGTLPSASGSNGPPRPQYPTSIAQDVKKRTIQGMAQSVVIVNDERQKVNARMAASMLANGF